MNKLKYFFRGYYIANTLVLLVYPLIRFYFSSAPNQLLLTDQFLPSSLGKSREIQVLSIATIFIFTKYIKSPTWESFFCQVFFYYKFAFVVLCYFIELWVFLWYTFILVVIWMLFRVPLYDGPSKFTEIGSRAEFEDIIRSDKIWVVLFYAEWDTQCSLTMSIWADLSLKYTTNKLRFGRVNVERASEVAAVSCVDESGLTGQLPTLIKYEGGKEIVRFPPIASDGRMSRVIKYKVGPIVSYLGLKEDYFSTLNT